MTPITTKITHTNTSKSSSPTVAQKSPITCSNLLKSLKSFAKYLLDKIAAAAHRVVSLRGLAPNERHHHHHHQDPDTTLEPTQSIHPNEREMVIYYNLSGDDRRTLRSLIRMYRCGRYPDELFEREEFDGLLRNLLALEEGFEVKEERREGLIWEVVRRYGGLV